MLVYAWNSNTKEGVAPPTRCFSSATPAIKKRMVRIPTKSYQMREIKSKQDGTQRLLRRDGWIALQAEER